MTQIIPGKRIGCDIPIITTFCHLDIPIHSIHLWNHGAISIRWSHCNVHRCNAVNFESNVCEEANVMLLEDIDVGQEEKSFLIRSEDAKYAFIPVVPCLQWNISKVAVEDLSGRRGLLQQGPTLRRGRLGWRTYLIGRLRWTTLYANFLCQLLTDQRRHTLTTILILHQHQRESAQKNWVNLLFLSGPPTKVGSTKMKHQVVTEIIWPLVTRVKVTVTDMTSAPMAWYVPLTGKNRRHHDDIKVLSLWTSTLVAWSGVQ